LTSEDYARLADILRSARLAVSYAGGMTAEQFEASQMTQDAVMYRLGIIGEAAGFVSAETQAALGLRWEAMRAMRHRLIHGYRKIRIDVVLSTVREDLPHLIATLEQVVE
jgi:uncharacterized protein with HEPN domain